MAPRGNKNAVLIAIDPSPSDRTVYAAWSNGAFCVMPESKFKKMKSWLDLKDNLKNGAIIKFGSVR